MALDHEAGVVGFASQPFWLFWPGRDRMVSHAPDFFARAADGTGIVIDCKPDGRIKPRDEAAFIATQQACAEMGWEFRLVTGHDPVWLANVRWLAGYRHRRYLLEPAASRLLEVFAEGGPLVAVVSRVGDPLAVLPVAFHLLWLGQLRTDLSGRLDGSSLVWRTAS
ncbi:TnsA-like heteromeric transposase endonuclease subunit [Nonomuraea sp. MTCD27]|uniref:TnsA-like heteromeric transposase endonuclease subunit n=1 Tax=Nonomuraea sp. MTCD27 TaxID=1676747 RepID=UPI0035C06B85